MRDKMYRGDVNKCSRGTTALLSYTTVNDTNAQIECSSTRSAIELWSGAARCNRLGEDCKRSQGVRTQRTIAVCERVINGHASVASGGNKYKYICSGV